MNFPQRAVIFLDEISTAPTRAKPLMLEAVLFCPILRWMRDKLQADGVQRFFVVCGPQFKKEVRACFPENADVTLSDQKSDLSEFLDTPDSVLVLTRAALPMEEAGPGFVYQASGRELQSVWRERLTNAIQEAEMLSGWLPVYGLETIAELEPLLLERIVKRHIQNGVRILDPSAVYIDPRVVIGRGTMLLPGTILQGETSIGKGCTIGPQALINGCTVGDGVEINASQVNESILGDGCDVGPYAHIRPNCTVGPNCHIGAFVQLKNCVLGEGTKMAHLTYVGDADVGSGVNFGCGTITTNYDGFQKFRCTIGDRAFIGCNTNLVSPVTVGEGAYIAAGATITKDVPADALAVARSKQENKEGWARRRRQMHGKDS
jgi:bifunctional UDP-N-acetylglucosamine pyrophosphorylase/glucosamine-1-phosphate N-acetyltransferase